VSVPPSFRAVSSPYVDIRLMFLSPATFFTGSSTPPRRAQPPRRLCQALREIAFFTYSILWRSQHCFLLPCTLPSPTFLFARKGFSLDFLPYSWSPFHSVLRSRHLLLRLSIPRASFHFTFFDSLYLAAAVFPTSQPHCPFFPLPIPA